MSYDRKENPLSTIHSLSLKTVPFTPGLCPIKVKEKIPSYLEKKPFERNSPCLFQSEWDLSRDRWDSFQTWRPLWYLHLQFHSLYHKRTKKEVIKDHTLFLISPKRSSRKQFFSSTLPIPLSKRISTARRKLSLFHLWLSLSIFRKPGLIWRNQSLRNRLF